MSNIDENINSPETQKNNPEREACNIDENVFTNPTQLKLTPFKAIQWINGGWSITPWPDVPPIPK